MRRYWYTGLLLFSLAAVSLWRGGVQVYGQLSAPAAKQAEEEREEQAVWQEQDRPGEDPAENGGNAQLPDTAGEETLSEEERFQPLFPENFQNVLLIGDSRTMGLYEYGDTGEGDVFAGRGMNVFDLWESKVSAEGKGTVTLEQLLAENQYQAVLLMLGVNELGYPMEQIVSQYHDTVERIRQMQPQARIILGANMHVTAEKSAASDIYNNEKINELNGYICQIGQEMGCDYIDINEKFDDSQGNLDAEYSTDGFHILGKYYGDWVQWLTEQTAAGS